MGVDARWPGPTADELAALGALGNRGTWLLQGRELALTNLDKELSPGRDGISPVIKRDLVAYMATIAPAMMPWFADRPMNVQRFPNGVERPGFWQKAVPSHAPDWLQRWHNTLAHKPADVEWYVVADGAASLAWLANAGVVEYHPWTSTAAHPMQPSWALIDIDPGERTTFEEIVVLAQLYEVALTQMQLVARPKVTGKRGVQIWIPIREGYTFTDTQGWVERLSRVVGGVVPDLVSWAWRKDDRQGRARLDYTQNASQKTLVGPYSPRPSIGMPVSVPITWEELHEPDLAPDRWHLRAAVERYLAIGDPFAALLGVEQDLPAL